MLLNLTGQLGDKGIWPSSPCFGETIYLDVVDHNDDATKMMLQ